VFLPFREGLPLAQEVDRLLPGAELAVPGAVRAELEGLVARGAALAAAARTFAAPLRTVPTVGRGDDAVEEAAVRLRATVVTADRALAERLRAVGVAVLVPRDRVRLELRVPKYPAAGPVRRRAGRARPKG
jgi:rRNA-processing protein FCF1